MCSIQLISIFLEVTSVTLCDLKARKRAFKDLVFCEVTMIHLLFEEIASRRGTSFPFYFNNDEYHEMWKKRSLKCEAKAFGIYSFKKMHWRYIYMQTNKETRMDCKNIIFVLSPCNNLVITLQTLLTSIPTP
jgi:hypothetical protein